MQTRPTVVAQEITLAIFGPIVFRLAGAEAFDLRLWRARETDERLGVTFGHQIWPIALVGVRIECQAQRTGQLEATSGRTVQELVAVSLIAQFEVAELMRAIFGWL